MLGCDLDGELEPCRSVGQAAVERERYDRPAAAQAGDCNAQGDLGAVVDEQREVAQAARGGRWRGWRACRAPSSAVGSPQHAVRPRAPEGRSACGVVRSTRRLGGNGDDAGGGHGAARSSGKADPGGARGHRGRVYRRPAADARAALGERSGSPDSVPSVIAVAADTLSVRLLDPRARPPARTREGDAGYDLRCLEGFRLAPGERATGRHRRGDRAPAGRRRAGHAALRARRAPRDLAASTARGWSTRTTAASCAS